jgi:hypothetical protein
MNNLINFRYDQLESVFSLKENEIVISFSFKELDSQISNRLDLISYLMINY